MEKKLGVSYGNILFFWGLRDKLKKIVTDLHSHHPLCIILKKMTSRNHTVIMNNPRTQITKQIWSECSKNTKSGYQNDGLDELSNNFTILITFGTSVLRKSHKTPIGKLTRGVVAIHQNA